MTELLGHLTLLLHSTLKNMFYAVLFITGLALKEFQWCKSLKSHGREADERFF